MYTCSDPVIIIKECVIFISQGGSPRARGAFAVVALERCRGGGGGVGGGGGDVGDGGGGCGSLFLNVFVEPPIDCSSITPDCVLSQCSAVFPCSARRPWWNAVTV